MFYNIMGRSGAVFFAIVGFIVLNFVCIPSIQAGSRTVWAFARDEMLPGSSIWYKIWPRSQTPVNAVWLYSALCIAVNLIGLGSEITIAAIFNICAVALNWSYCIPIFCKLFYGRFERGPWHLGKASTVVNIWACSWNTFISVIFLFPTMRPVDASNVSFRISATGEKTLANPLETDELRRRRFSFRSSVCLCILVHCWPEILFWA
jgi:amino acid transporter